MDNYAKDRCVHSPEFSLWGLKGLQCEWYPKGTEASFPGWTALKLRIPVLQTRCKVTVKWRVV
jgi:hypothetical protein